MKWVYGCAGLLGGLGLLLTLFVALVTYGSSGGGHSSQSPLGSGGPSGDAPLLLLLFGGLSLLLTLGAWFLHNRRPQSPRNAWAEYERLSDD